MKEVEFRAWDLKDKRMYHNVGIVGTLIILEHEQSGYEFCELELKSYDHIDNNYELMQYTGLKDKNGKKIFGGDIVEYDGWFYIIKWDEEEAGFYMHDKNNYEDDHLRMIDISVGEVMGNIYENQNLIK
ncbi:MULTISPECIES: YopX family protein [Bacillus]|uniref:YopX family protein n=1 Tax=Bacillus TaxID=1386 RepID=UPI003D64B5AF